MLPGPGTTGNGPPVRRAVATRDALA